MYRRMDDSYPDNSTNFTTNEQTHQEQLQPAVKKPLEHEEEASHTLTGTLTQPRFAGNPYNGLRNQGATCYLNSVLQCFYMTEDFRREVENFTRDPTNTDKESTALIEELQKLFKMLKEHDGTTKGITQCLGIYSVYEQQDVVEYYQKILYMITPQMSKIFMGLLKTTTKCLKCHQQEQKTPIFFIPLPINSDCGEVFSVAMGIENISKVGKLGKDNLIYCDLCEEKAEAETWTEIETFPTILTVNLKRFHFNYVYNTLVKNHCPVEVSLHLEFKNHTKYELYAVINHMGGENGGHYNVVIKSFEDNEWYCFDDSFVTKKCGFEEYLKRSQGAYLLMYRRMDDSYPDNSTNFTTNEQTHQKQLQSAVKISPEHTEQALNTPTTQPRSFPENKNEDKHRFRETKSTRYSTDRTRKGKEELRLLPENLGRRVVLLQENCDHKREFDKMVVGCFCAKAEDMGICLMHFKAFGGCGQRPPESTASNNSTLLYIVKPQDMINTSLQPIHEAEYEKMLKLISKKFKVKMPLRVLALHIKNCALESETVSDENKDMYIIYVSEGQKRLKMELGPVCGRFFSEDMVDFVCICIDNLDKTQMLSEWIEDNAAGLSNSRVGGKNNVAGPSKRQEDSLDDVVGSFNRSGGDAATCEGVSPHFFSTALNGSRINFGNIDTTLLFGGESDHLRPFTSQIIVERDTFLMARRMVGHSFIHGGPGLSGISHAVLVRQGSDPDHPIQLTDRDNITWHAEKEDDDNDDDEDLD